MVYIPCIEYIVIRKDLKNLAGVSVDDIGV